MIVKPNEKWQVYGKLLEFEDSSQVDFKEVAAKFCISHNVVSAYIKNL